MITITFTPGAHDGEAKDNPSRFPAGLVYLAVQAEAIDGEYSGYISGWVRPEVAKLVKAAPDLLSALKAVLPLVKHTDDNGWHQMKFARDTIIKATE